jgi:hypothetical protein
MDRETTSPTQYQQVIVDVPEDRVAEFHAFFARFLAGPRGRGRGGRHGRPHHGRHGHGHDHGRRCGDRRESAGRSETTESSEPTSAPSEL